jgi:cobalt-precorrin-5B (C1)-methyltransferase
LTGNAHDHVTIRLLNGDTIDIPIESCRIERRNRAFCMVIKDAGDDPDVTHRAKICATVSLEPHFHAPQGQTDVRITGGNGVGTITKPGLEIPPGEPAINPGPRQMIREAVQQVVSDHPFSGRVATEISVVNGEKIAQKTLNYRLGIIGGISILGTTGIVKPMSHEAYRATITSAISVAAAMKVAQLVFTTGRRSERYAMGLWPDLPETAFIQIGDYFRFSFASAKEMGVRWINLAVFFGKAVKMAYGAPHTHAARSQLTLERLSRWTFDCTHDADLANRIGSANTARHAFDILRIAHREVFATVGAKMIAHAQSFSDMHARVRGVIFDYDGGVVFDSKDKP